MHVLDLSACINIHSTYRPAGGYLVHIIQRCWGLSTNGNMHFKVVILHSQLKELMVRWVVTNGTIWIQHEMDQSNPEI